MPTPPGRLLSTSRGRLVALGVGLPLAVAALVLGVIACDARRDARARSALDRAFATPIESAQVTMDIEARVDGLPQLSAPLRLRAAGPYRSGGPRRIPSFDWDLQLSGPGTLLGAGLTSTGDNVFVSFEGVDYEIGRGPVAETNAQLAAGPGGRGGGQESLGVDPRAWLVEPADEGEATVGGEATTRYAARLDAARALEDLAGLGRRAAPGLRRPPPAPLTPQQRTQLRRLTGNATVDVYVAERDGGVRRLSVRVPVRIPPERRAEALGATGGVLSFSIEFSRVGAPQPIAGPRRARPIEDLERQIGPVVPGAGGAPPPAGP